jgi:hypothetical protein
VPTRFLDDEELDRPLKFCVLPAWCRDLVELDPASRPIKFFSDVDRYKVGKKLVGPELDRFIAALLCRFEFAFKSPFTERIMENILCKARRVLSNDMGDERWCDTLLTDQRLYQFKKNSVLVLSPCGGVEEVEGNAVINRWPYGGAHFTMEELVVEFGFPSVLPTNERIGTYQFGRKVWNPTARFDVEFNVPPANPVSKMAEAETISMLSKWIGVSRIGIGVRKRKVYGVLIKVRPL